MCRCQEPTESVQTPMEVETAPGAAPFSRAGHRSLLACSRSLLEVPFKIQGLIPWESPSKFRGSSPREVLQNSGAHLLGNLGMPPPCVSLSLRLELQSHSGDAPQCLPPWVTVLSGLVEMHSGCPWWHDRGGVPGYSVVLLPTCYLHARCFLLCR